MPPVFRLAVALVVLALATPGAQQREAGTGQQPTFRAGVNVVNVDVSVTGRNDEAVASSTPRASASPRMVFRKSRRHNSFG
jgi:hypothetical protein